uniref:Guanylate cyclase n=1 Tax=Trichobilharzia regenti TaxID=157069 RepID=A0AA85J547_TRIRE|nr:unnamed protein product [Trichobilharzia regenti]
MLVLLLLSTSHWNKLCLLLFLLIRISSNIQEHMTQFIPSTNCNQKIYQTISDTNEQVSALCWLADANFTSLQLLDSCLGLNLGWTVQPPSQWNTFETITIKFRINTGSSFYGYATQLNVFSRIPLISTSIDASSYCSAELCKIFNVENTCCVWHISLFMESVPSPNGAAFTSKVCDFNNFNNATIPVYSGSSLNSEWNVLVPSVTLPGIYLLFIRILIGRFQGTFIKKVTISTSESHKLTNTLQIAEIVLIVLASILILTMLSGFLYYLKTKKRKEKTDEETWVIQPDTISEIDPEDKWFKLFLSRSTNCSLVMIGNTPVAMKKVDVKYTSLTKEMEKQLWQVKKMKHENLVKLIGITLIPPVLSLYTEFCDRGSLCYVLRRDSIPLNWSLRVGFLTDLANGLAFLHNYPLVHGRLCSTNCVISEKWTCKITDYGLDSLFWPNDDEKYRTFLEKPENLAYIAPEYREYQKCELVTAVDIYSFGTIMWEAATRKDPTEDDEFLAEPMLNHPEFPTKRCFETDLKYEATSGPPMEGYNKMMEACWSDISLRPNLNSIIEWLNEINPRKIIADASTVLNKEYSRCLESIIEDRTQALRSEQKMADTLLNSMLPKQVVEMLRHGENVPPEAFEQCTIYFSDIVGFTTISSSSTPFEVVEFLNKLYTQFDDIIDRYDVYKVETIGDAYMVASGVPRRNGERHAIAIADMSLDLVSVSHSFVIPHKPNEPLKIRVGLHSGPVCAGVVGLKMPRYCLFGDTVNTASRMESTGEAYKIHCSETTHAILERLGGFTFEKRGTITVKGKGDMQTWWITGRTRADLAKDCCPLPLNWKKRLKKVESTNKEESQPSTVTLITTKQL